MKYLLEYRSFILSEGGNAFPETVSVKREDIQRIVAEFNDKVVQGILGSQPGEPIGSWKQKPISGDIDCLVYTDLELPKIVELCKAQGIDAKAFYGFNIVSTNFTPTGHEPVQIDIFVRPQTANKEATDIFYKNIEEDPDTTKHRVYFLFTVLDSRKEDIEGDPASPSKFTGYMLRPDGLYKIVKEMKKVNYKIMDRQLIAESAEDMAKAIFGQPLPFSEWNTFKKTFDLFIKSPLYPNKQEIIVAYTEKLKEEGLPLPTSVTLDSYI
jgi:hypothetical protein